MGIPGAVSLLPVISREQNHHQFVDDFNHHALIRLVEGVHLVNIPPLAVISQDLLHDPVDFHIQRLFIYLCAVFTKTAEVIQIQLTDV